MLDKDIAVFRAWSGVYPCFSSSSSLLPTPSPNILVYIYGVPTPNLAATSWEPTSRTALVATFAKSVLSQESGFQYSGEFNSLFGSGQFQLSGKSNVTLLEEKMKKAETDATALTQKITDASIMTEEEFEKKYGESLKKFKKENDIKWN